MFSRVNMNYLYLGLCILISNTIFPFISGDSFFRTSARRSSSAFNWAVQRWNPSRSSGKESKTILIIFYILWDFIIQLLGSIVTYLVILLQTQERQWREAQNNSNLRSRRCYIPVFTQTWWWIAVIWLFPHHKWSTHAAVTMNAKRRLRNKLVLDVWWKYPHHLARNYKKYEWIV